MDRHTFIKRGLVGSLGISLFPAIAYSNLQDNKEPLKTSLVKEFVIAGHSNISKVKEMLTEYPNLNYCRYDWGNGDFEEAIEGAGHLGNKEIANYLIENGARVNLFVLTMLGKTELVKPVIEAYPQLLYANGAHGLTLLHHAKVGGEDAQELLEYFTKNGLTKTKVNIR